MVMIVGETVWMMEQNFLVLYTKDRYNWSTSSNDACQYLQFCHHHIWPVCSIPFSETDFKASNYVNWMFDMHKQSRLLWFVCFLCEVMFLNFIYFYQDSSWNCSILLYIKLNFYCSGSCAQFAPFANILAGVQSIIYRSSLSVLLPPEELGSVFALLEIFVALIPSGFTPVASWLYNETLSTFPGDSLN